MFAFDVKSFSLLSVTKSPRNKSFVCGKHHRNYQHSGSIPRKICIQGTNTRVKFVHLRKLIYALLLISGAHIPGYSSFFLPRPRFKGPDKISDFYIRVAPGKNELHPQRCFVIRQKPYTILSIKKM